MQTTDVVPLKVIMMVMIDTILIPIKLSQMIVLMYHMVSSICLSEYIIHVAMLEIELRLRNTDQSMQVH